MSKVKNDRQSLKDETVPLAEKNNNSGDEDSAGVSFRNAL